jgi:hypothetical protein
MDGFQRMNGKSKGGEDIDIESFGEGSEIELNRRGGEIGMAHDGTAQTPKETWNGEGIQVKTDFDLTIERVRKEIEVENAKSKSRLAM